MACTLVKRSFFKQSSPGHPHEKLDGWVQTWARVRLLVGTWWSTDTNPDMFGDPIPSFWQ